MDSNILMFTYKKKKLIMEYQILNTEYINEY